MWPFCPMAFMLGTGFQSIFEIWPAATSWPRAAGVPQPFAGAQLWLSCGLWLLGAAAGMGAGMLECAIPPGQLASPGQSCWCGELWAVEGLLCEQLAPWGEIKSWAWFGFPLGRPEYRELLGAGWAVTSAQPAGDHSCPSAWGLKGLPQWAVTTAPMGEHSVWEQHGLSWAGRLVTVFLGELCWGCWFGKHVEGSGSRKEEWGHEMEGEELRKTQWGDPGARAGWVGQEHGSQPEGEVPLQREDMAPVGRWSARNLQKHLELRGVPCRNSVFRVKSGSPYRACRDREILGQLSLFGEHLKCYIYY